MSIKSDRLFYDPAERAKEKSRRRPSDAAEVVAGHADEVQERNRALPHAATLTLVGKEKLWPRVSPFLRYYTPAQLRAFAKRDPQAFRSYVAGARQREIMGRLIAWRDEFQKAFRFPGWQFQHQQVLNGLETVLATLNANSRLDDYGRMLFFLSNMGFLGSKRPLDCLREDEVTKAVQAAQGYCQ